MRFVFEQPVRQPHPDFDAGLAGRKIRHEELSLAHYLDDMRAEGAIVERCPDAEIPFQPIPGHWARFNIFGSHAHSELYRYRLPHETEWGYVLLWESDQ